MMLKQTLISIFLITSIGLADANPVKIWDAKAKELDTSVCFDFRSSQAWSNKANWIQVPYGTTNYVFQGQAIIEQDDFFLWIKMGCKLWYGEPSIIPKTGQNLIYERGATLYGRAFYDDGTYYWNKNPRLLTIIENSPQKVSVRVDGDSVPNKNLIIYTVTNDLPVVKMEADTLNSYYLPGIHYSAGRYGVSPPNNGTGNDFVVDSYLATILQGDNGNVYYLPSTNNIWMLQDMSSRFSTMITYPDPIFANPVIKTSTGTDGTYKRLETMIAKMKKGSSNPYIYVVTFPYRIQYYSTPNFNGLKGNVYISLFNPVIPGKYRMSGRINGVYYTQEVTNGNFNFIMPVAGMLEFLEIYLYDRTSATPTNIKTPMDIYKNINSYPSPTYPTPTPSPIVTSVPTSSPTPYQTPTPTIPPPTPSYDPFFGMVPYITQLLNSLFK